MEGWTVRDYTGSTWRVRMEGLIESKRWVVMLVGAVELKIACGSAERRKRERAGTVVKQQFC